MSLLNKRIPTILGLLILLTGIGAGIYFVGKDSFLTPQAAPELTPKKVKIANVKSDQFTVSWLTSKATTGFVRYGNTPTLNTTMADDREQRSGAAASYQTHYVSLSGLQPATKYYFKIGSGSEKNLFDNNGRPYEITTAPNLGAAPPADLANGKVLTAAGTAAAGAMVYLTLPEAAPLSALVANDGSWVVSLAGALKSDLTSYLQYDLQTAPLDVLVQGDSQTAKALTSTGKDNPVPELTLGQTYDFRSGAVAANPSPTPPATPGLVPQETTPEIAVQTLSQFPTEPISTVSAAATASAAVKLTNPAKAGETIQSLRPEIIGTGPAKKVLTITIESPKTYTATVTVNNDGSWSYTPPENLTPGQHTITIDYVDNEGRQQTVKQTFVVAAATGESLPAFTATPSASATASATPSARRTMPSTASGVPKSGSVTPTVLLFLTGFILLGTGFIFKLHQNQ